MSRWSRLWSGDECRVMGQRPPSPPDPPPAPPPLRAAPAANTGPLWLALLVLLINFAAALGHGHGAVCDLDACTRAYDESLESRGLAGPEGSAAYCGVLYDFGICMHNIRRACRGNLNYHTSNTMLIHLKTIFECAKRLQQETGSATGVPRKHGRPPLPPSTPRPDRPSTMAPPEAAQAGPECSYRGSRNLRHCGLFGDPHLKTFKGNMQTCRVQGAWPLVDNPYLAVQVTNEPVLFGSQATATTKVTVLVKGSATPCLNQTKTYEATADAPLPDTFIDGTNKSGPGEAVTIRYQDTAFGSLVEIRIRYIETTVIVRKVGRYLAFSTSMPDELVSWHSGQGDDQGTDGVQLCVQGCPLSEIMDLDSDRGHVLSWADALAKCVAKTSSSPPSTSTMAAADSNEGLGDLTDQYLDWCVFDLMTTGKEDFVLAARSAHRDTLAMDPGAAGNLRNRTAAQDVGAGAAGGASAASTTGAAAAAGAPGALLLLALAGAVLAAPRNQPR
ncbi:repulsive guidance molecule A isoform X1 [Frankliniella occidentalis]|uniref:Repulsive guidance molecule A isoform X1 n=2 Tax=Frankliniella occidentalis TaxID=133901 RepID=A0A9C6U2H9_FRAOC|nr:repulsive guidance molecule A isoform X1 [Frankliniella occidentalis]